MDRLIRTTTEHFLAMLDDQREFYSLQELLDAGLPDFLVKRMRLELVRNLQDSVTPPQTDWADMTTDAVQKAWRRFLGAIHEEIRLPASYVAPVIESAVADILDLMVTPRAFLPEYIFGSESRMNQQMIAERCEWVVVYTYFANALPRFMEKKGRKSLTKEQADRIIERLDERITSHYTSLNWAQLFDPWFQLLGEKVEPGLFANFFRDKGKPGVARLFDAEPDPIHRTRLIEILSKPQLDEFDDDFEDVGEDLLGVPEEVMDLEQSKDIVSPTGKPKASDAGEEKEDTGKERLTAQDQDTVAAGKEDAKDKKADAAEPEVKPDETKVKTDEKKKKSEEPEKKSDEPEKKPDDPEKKSDEPAAKAEDSKVKTREQAEESKDPEAKSEDPEVKSKEMEVKSQKPETTADKSEMKPEREKQKSEERDSKQKSEEIEEPEVQKMESDEKDKAADEDKRKDKGEDEDENDEGNLITRFQKTNGNDKHEPPLVSTLKTDPEEDEEDTIPLYSKIKPDREEGDEEVPIWQQFTKADEEAAGELDDENDETPVSGEEPAGAESVSAEELEKIRSYIKDMEEEFVSELFGGDEGAFLEAIEHISRLSDWKEAGTYISKEVFDRNLIDIYSDTAIYFTDRMQTYFLERE